MHRWLFPLVLALAGCPSAADEGAVNAGDDDGKAPDPSGQSRGCFVDEDCELASRTCCECPTYALSAGDPKLDACGDVDCPPTQNTCSRVRAVCEANLCELACEPQAVAASCASGFATDAAGCLIDACAQPKSECSVDTDCVRTRADCCGCARGGADTAVASTQRGAFDASLGCTGAESCPEVVTCAANETPQCAQGACKLIAGDLPPDACGRPDLAPCPAGKTCTVNASKTADLHGVGVCR